MIASDAVKMLLPPFCLCLIMVGIHSYLGLHVIRRGIIFVDLALAQIAALGALIGFLLGIPLHTTASHIFSVFLTAVAAVVFTLARTREERVPQEAIIGLTYAIAAATALILLDKAPHGADHIKDILTGSILWVEWRAVVTIAVIYGLVGLFHFAFRRQFLAITEDASAARSAGLNVGLWDFLFYVSFGIVITLSTNTAGVLLVFIFLVAPAVMAVLITDRLFYQLIFGWVVGFVVTMIGLAVSYAGDLSAGPLVIGSYAVAIVVVSAVVHVARAADRARAVRRVVTIAAAFAVCILSLVVVGRAVGERYRRHAHIDTHRGAGATEPSAAIDGVPDHRAAELDDTSGGLGDTRDDDEAEAADAQAGPGDVYPDAGGPSTSDHPARSFVTRFDDSDDPAERADIVSEALDADPIVGAKLALRYLEGEPPLFFAQTVVDALDATLSGPSGFDVEQPFSAQVNQQAAARVREELGLR